MVESQEIGHEGSVVFALGGLGDGLEDDEISI